LTIRRFKQTHRKETGGKRQRDEERKNPKYYQMGPGRRRYKINREKEDDRYKRRRSLRLQMKKNKISVV
jgi:hypothetical protein